MRALLTDMSGGRSIPDFQPDRVKMLRVDVVRPLVPGLERIGVCDRRIVIDLEKAAPFPPTQITVFFRVSCRWLVRQHVLAKGAQIV